MSALTLTLAAVLAVAVPLGAQASSAALTTADVAALAVAPECGGLRATDTEVGRRLLRRIVATARRESGLRPYIIGVNPDRRRGLPGYPIFAASAEEAAAALRRVIAAGRTAGAGLMQIDSPNLARHGLIPETVFLPCPNVRAGVRHYAADLRHALDLASRRYNTGSTERGAGYAASVTAIEDALPADLGTSSPSTAAVGPRPLPPPPPAEPPCAPAWDAWALAECSARQPPRDRSAVLPSGGSPRDPARPPQGGPSTLTATAGNPDADPSLPPAR